MHYGTYTVTLKVECEERQRTVSFLFVVKGPEEKKEPEKVDKTVSSEAKLAPQFVPMLENNDGDV